MVGMTTEEEIKQLKGFIADERKAIEAYQKKSHSSISAIESVMWHTIATEEMGHLQLIEERLDSLEHGKCTVD